MGTGFLAACVDGCSLGRGRVGCEVREVAAEEGEQLVVPPASFVVEIGLREKAASSVDS